MTTASYPSDYKETEAREFNPETNSGIKLSTLENLLKSQSGQITSQKGI